jgi:Na+-transporting NADH:ubiquinone oxidoreductase subunit NqrB
MKLNWIIFVTGWMSFRAVGSGLFLFWIFTENERSAPSEWIVPFVGDFIIGITALFLVYHIIKKTKCYLMGSVIVMECNWSI